jgi:hypothetical protein
VSVYSNEREVIQARVCQRGIETMSVPSCRNDLDACRCLDLLSGESPLRCLCGMRLVVLGRFPRDCVVSVWIWITRRGIARRKRLFDGFVQRCLSTLAFSRIAVRIGVWRMVHDDLDNIASSSYERSPGALIAIPAVNCPQRRCRSVIALFLAAMLGPAIAGYVTCVPFTRAQGVSV